MDLEKIARILIFAHAALGGFALMTGAVALLSRKGSPMHRQSGKGFFNAMTFSAVIALVVSVMPRHQSPFLFSIGLFTLYFLVSGRRSLWFHLPDHNFQTDRWIARAALALGVGMVALPPLLSMPGNVVLTTFGLALLAFGTRDLMLLKAPPTLAKKRIALHLGKMTGGYIAAVTAFCVVNQILPGLWNWFLPTVVGTAFIIFQLRRHR
ncbi:MAG: DUF2306 domain-containing protein [Bacteroidetes bacterium]|nr:MAG: DUF2306 domain-containing protein [Bacteroidota bacterium]